MKKIFILLTLASVALFASEATEKDIIQRAVSFVIFVYLINYFAGASIKNFFVTRSMDIKSRFDDIENKKKSSQEELQQAKNKLAEAQQLAQKIKDDIANEIVLIKNGMEKKTQTDIANLVKLYAQKEAVSQKKMEKQVVETFLHEVLAQTSETLSSEQLINKLIKKVA